MTNLTLEGLYFQSNEITCKGANKQNINYGMDIFMVQQS